MAGPWAVQSGSGESYVKVQSDAGVKLLMCWCCISMIPRQMILLNTIDSSEIRPGSTICWQNYRTTGFYYVLFPFVTELRSPPNKNRWCRDSSTWNFSKTASGCSTVKSCSKCTQVYILEDEPWNIPQKHLTDDVWRCFYEGSRRLELLRRFSKDDYGYAVCMHVYSMTIFHVQHLLG